MTTIFFIAKLLFFEFGAFALCIQEVDYGLRLTALDGKIHLIDKSVEVCEREFQNANSFSDGNNIIG